MEKVVIPGTGRAVYPLCFGQASIGVSTSEEVAGRLLDVFLDEGGEFIDSARIYSDWVAGEVGRSERVLGDYFRRTGKRDKFLICTKGGHGPLGQPGLDLEMTRRDLDASLQALGGGEIDLYVLHRDNESLSVEEIYAMLDAARLAGKIRAFGVSNWKLPRWQKFYELAGGEAVNQIGYSAATEYQSKPLGDKTLVEMDAAMRDFHIETQAFAMAYMGIAGGYFAKFAAGQDVSGTRYDSPQNRDRAAEFAAQAQQQGCSANEIAIAFLLDEKFPVVPMFGTTQEKNLREIMRCISGHI